MSVLHTIRKIISRKLDTALKQAVTGKRTKRKGKKKVLSTSANKTPDTSPAYRAKMVMQQPASQAGFTSARRAGALKNMASAAKARKGGQLAAAKTAIKYGHTV